MDTDRTDRTDRDKGTDGDVVVAESAARAVVSRLLCQLSLALNDLAEAGELGEDDGKVWDAIAGHWTIRAIVAREFDGDGVRGGEG